MNDQYLGPMGFIYRIGIEGYPFTHLYRRASRSPWYQCISPNEKIIKKDMDNGRSSNGHFSYSKTVSHSTTNRQYSIHN